MGKTDMDSLWNLSQAAAWILYRRNDWVEALTSGGGANFGAMQLYPSLNPRPDPALGSLSDLLDTLKCGHLSATGIRSSDTERLRTPIPKNQWQDLVIKPPRAMDATTGREAWVIEEVPHLRIVDHDLWDRVKDRQSSTRRRVSYESNVIRSERARRPRYLLSGLLRCGSCGGGFSKISQHHYGCATARNKGTCDNFLSIRRDIIEAAVLDGLKEHLMHPECVKAFVSEYHTEMNRLAATQDTERDRLARDLTKTEHDIQKLINAIKEGVPGSAIKDEMQTLEDRRQELAHAMEKAPASIPRLHPNLAQLYRDKVDRLTEALNEDSSRSAAAEAIRALIEEVRLVPDDGSLKIELYGELAALINLANEHPRSKDTGVQVTMVAGACSHLYRTSLTRRCGMQPSLLAR